MNLQNSLSEQLKSAFKTLFNLQLESVEYQATRKDFEGDITVVTFPMLRLVKMNPEELGKQLGDYLVQNSEQTEENCLKRLKNNRKC